MSSTRARIPRSSASAAQRPRYHDSTCDNGDICPREGPLPCQAGNRPLHHRSEHGSSTQPDVERPVFSAATRPPIWLRRIRGHDNSHVRKNPHETCLQQTGRSPSSPTVRPHGSQRYFTLPGTGCADALAHRSGTSSRQTRQMCWQTLSSRRQQGQQQCHHVSLNNSHLHETLGVFLCKPASSCRSRKVCIGTTILASRPPNSARVSP